MLTQHPATTTQHPKSILGSALSKVRARWADSLEGRAWREDSICLPLAGMSAGVIPVVIHRGGLPEIVKHNENGFLAQTPEAMATLTAQVFLYSDPAEYSRLQQTAMRDAKEFSAAAFAGKLRAIAVDAAREIPFRQLIKSSSGKWPHPKEMEITRQVNTGTLDCSCSTAAYHPWLDELK